MPPAAAPPRTLSVAATAQVTVVSVPEDCCGFVMGRQGATLRSMEEEVRPSVCCRACHTRALLCCCAGRGLRSIPSTAALTQHARTPPQWGTLMCFAKVGAERQEKLCIFGSFRARRGAELKVRPRERLGFSRASGERERSERVRVLPRSCVRVVELSGVPPPCV